MFNKMKSRLILCIVFLPSILKPAKTIEHKEWKHKSLIHVERIIDKLLTSRRLEDLVEKAVRRAMEKQYTNFIYPKSVERSINLTNLSNQNVSIYHFSDRKNSNNNEVNTSSIDFKKDFPEKVKIRPNVKEEALTPFKNLSLQYKRFTKTSTLELVTKMAKYNYNNASNKRLDRDFTPTAQDDISLPINKKIENNAISYKHIEKDGKTENLSEQSSNKEMISKEYSVISAENGKFDSTELEADFHELKNKEYNYNHQKATSQDGLRTDNRKHENQPINIKEDKSSDYSQYYYEKSQTQKIYKQDNKNNYKVKNDKEYHAENNSEIKYSKLDKSSLDSEEDSANKEKYTSRHSTKKPLTTIRINENYIIDKYDENVSNEETLGFNKVTSGEKKAVTEMKLRREGDKIFAFENLSDYKEYHELLSASTTEKIIF